MSSRPAGGSMLRDSIMASPVFDTHTHLDESAGIAAENPWDILHYFWFKRELHAAGYPADAEQLSEQARREAFLRAFEGSSNTYWNTIVRRMLRDLFACSLETVADVELLARRIQETSHDLEWPASVCDRMGVTHIVVGPKRIHAADSLLGRLVVVPYHSPQEEADPLESIEYLLTAGKLTVRLDLDPFLSAIPLPQALSNRYEPVFGALNEAGARVQVFTGMKRDWKHHTMLNDPGRIVGLYPLFERYPGIQFEFVNAAAGNDLDIVQAARVFTNVHPGGFWWFNFRASSYHAALQQRFEALPTSRSAIVASDARCIEWLYAKVLYIKTVLSEFLEDQVARGWIDGEGALKAASDWLHDTALAGYVEE